MTAKVPATKTVPVHHEKMSIITDGNMMYSTQKVIFKLIRISDDAHTTNVLLGLKSGALI